MFRHALLLSAILATAAPVTAQRVPDTVDLPDASSTDDVIVSALRIPRNKLPTAVYWNYPSVRPGRIARENADLFLRCATKLSSTSLLRRVVDGEPNSADARFAQGWMIVTRQGCYPPRATPTGGVPDASSIVVDVGQSAFDRGVIIEQALTAFAPDAALTLEDTTDPAVQNRFKTRETKRNRLRLPRDRDALQFASCLVQRQPELATRLFRSKPGSSLEQGLTQTIIVEGRECVGNIRRVTIDASFARVAIMDAFYRWLVAARDTDSLIPADA